MLVIVVVTVLMIILVVDIISVVELILEIEINTKIKTIIVLLIALLPFILLAPHELGTPIETERVEEQYREIVSIKDGERGKGFGFLLVYSYSERDVYSYYYITENGGYKRETIEGYNVTVFEEDNCIPRITKETTYSTKRELWGLKWDVHAIMETEYNIYVPKGSIVREFELDAE